jgi:hypothetical protein
MARSKQLLFDHIPNHKVSDITDEREREISRTSTAILPSHPAMIVQRALQDPRTLTPQNILVLQRTMGNQYVKGLIQRTRATRLNTTQQPEEEMLLGKAIEAEASLEAETSGKSEPAPAIVARKGKGSVATPTAPTTATAPDNDPLAAFRIIHANSPKVLPVGASVKTVLMKRKNIRLHKMDYGHWWTEIGENRPDGNSFNSTESYGWWPTEKVGLVGTFTGVPGSVNRGNPTDPHHGETDADTQFYPVLTVSKSYKDIADDIRTFAASYNGKTWRWTFGGGRNCHTFQVKMMKAVGLKKP